MRFLRVQCNFVEPRFYRSPGRFQPTRGSRVNFRDGLTAPEQRHRDDRRRYRRFDYRCRTVIGPRINVFPPPWLTRKTTGVTLTRAHVSAAVIFSVPFGDEILEYDYCYYFRHFGDGNKKRKEKHEKKNRNTTTAFTAAVHWKRTAGARGVT